MTLDKLFSKPTKTEHMLRVLVYGPTKTGKSHWVATATEIGPLYWIDTEGGSGFYDSELNHGFRVLRDSDPRKALEAIEAANKLIDNGADPRPIIGIDSFSSTWFEQKMVTRQTEGPR